jgi:ATP-dependent helicase/nuclease subunit A
MSARAAGDADRSRFVGTLAHRILHMWDFTRSPEQCRARIAAVCASNVPAELEAQRTAIEAELLDLFQAFTASQPYQMLQRAEIIGREVPFVMPWEAASRGTRDARRAKEEMSRGSTLVSRACTPCVMEGVIDVLYRLDGRVRLADYKTDRVEDSELEARAAAYAPQAAVYRDAVAKSLKITDVGVDIIFVRNGRAVSL